MKTILTLAALLFACAAFAQPITPPGVVWVNSAPTGSCGYGPVYITLSTGAMTACVNGTYGSVGGGITTGGSLPATCTVGQAYGLTSGAVGLYYCTATNTWTSVQGTNPYACSVSGAAAVPGTDLAIDATLNTKVTSATHTFVTGDVGAPLTISGGTGFTTGTYFIQSVSSGAAILNSAAGTVGSTGGTYSLSAHQACTHNLNTSRPFVACYDANGNMLGGSGSSTSVTSVVATSSNAATLAFSGTTTATCLITTGGVPAGTQVQLIASGTAVLGTSAVSANACATLVTVSATGVATTDTISYTPNADISGVTGYGVASTDGLIIYPYPTANNVNFHVCNGTGTSITPGAVTLNWRVTR